MNVTKMFPRLLLAMIVSLQLTGSVYAQKIGLELYSLREQFKQDVPATLAQIKKWNITEIEGGGTYGYPVADFKKMLLENNLQMISYGADFNELRDSTLQLIQNAKAFGCSYIMCAWILHKGTDFTEEDLKKAVALFNEKGKQIKASGLQFVYHTHGYEFKPYGNGNMFDYLVKNTDPKYVNFEMDVFWVKHPGQDPVALLKKYPNRFSMLHLKDRAIGTEGNQFGTTDVETNVVLGQGDVGIAAIMKEAKKIGVKHYFIEDESSRSVEQIPQSLLYLSSLK